jgi:hypothetical protein
MIPTVVAMTPIKYNSSRLKNKNFLDLGGFPLYHHATDTVDELKLFPPANQVNWIQCIYCNQETWGHIDEVTKQQFVHVREQTTPEGQDGNQLFQYMAQDFMHQYPNFNVGWFFFFNVTCPFVQPATYLSVLNTINCDRVFDSACTVLDIAGRMWQLDSLGGSMPVLHQPCRCQRTQDQKPVYLESEACWLVKPDIILEERRRVGHYPFFVGVDWIEAIDINYPGDLEVARKWLGKK